VSRPTNEAFAQETNLRQLELAVTRKLDGLLHGEIQTLQYGPGSERGEGRAYQPGDDARRIDWNVSARMNELHVRDTIADRELETWLVVDTSASLDFGTCKWEKRDLALAAAAAFGLLGARGGNRIGALIFGGDGVQILPPRGGTKAVMQLLKRLDSRPRADESVASLALALGNARRTSRRRGRVVVISDLLDDSPWESELRYLAARHDVIVAQICDPREWSLPASGLLTFVDPESGQRIEVQTSDRGLQARFAKAATERRDQIEKSVGRSGARHLILSTDRDWMLDLVDFVARSRRAAAR
jgi:uncharacterized protein (DUF58 family)